MPMNSVKSCKSSESPAWLMQNPGQAKQPLPGLGAGEMIHHLRQSGMFLLRGFDVSHASFENFTARLCDRFHDVGTRQAIDTPNSDGYTSEVPKSNFSLFAHSEGAYRPWPPPPDVCFFNCVRSPGDASGQTMLVDGAGFLERLPEELQERFDRQGVIYQARWDEARWRTEFGVNSLEELDALVLAHPQCEYQIEGECIEVRCQVPAIQVSMGGARAFANGLLAHLPHVSHPRWQGLNAYSKGTNRVFFGDGEEIPEDVIHRLIDIQDEIALNHAWRGNDLLVLDNTRVMHGRRETEGGGERIIRSRFGRLLAQHAVEMRFE